VKATKVAVDGNQIYYADNNNGYLRYVENDSNGWSGPTQVTYTQGEGSGSVKDINADAVLGVADVDGDTNDEIVYTDSGTIRYIQVGSNENPTDTGEGYGNNNGPGLGRPVDFDGDGKALVPVITGSNEVALVDAEAGDKTVIGSYAGAAKAPFASYDINGDGTAELVFANSSGYLEAMNYSTGTVTTVTDQNGNPIRVKTGNGEGTGRLDPPRARSVASGIIRQ